MHKPKTFSIINLGCPKNQVDAEIMLSQLTSSGWQLQLEPDDPDVVIVNTCAFIESAQQESIDTLLAAFQEFPRSQIVAAGCLSQRYAEELAAEMPELAAVFGNRSPDRIAHLMERLTERSEDTSPQPVVMLPDGDDALAGPERTQLLSPAATAYVKIAEGCDHSCTFCAIPSIRGKTRERSPDEIVKEVRSLVERGIHEITLVAQDLAAYSQPDLVTLVHRILEIPGDYWIRPMYLYPDNFPIELASIATEDPRFLPYFDLSFQHADRRILKRMGRGGSAESYLELIDLIRQENLEAVIRTSLIVGFPGETDESIDTLIDFLNQAQLDWVGVFTFSPQDGTPAMKWVERGELAEPETLMRWKRRVETHQQGITRDRLKRHVGRRTAILVEEPVLGTDLYMGRAWFHAQEIDGLVVLSAPEGSYVPGDLVQADITGVNGIDLAASLDG